jgi:hypothetical protein
MEISNEISNASVPSFHGIFNYWGCLDCLFSALVLLPTETTSPVGLSYCRLLQGSLTWGAQYIWPSYTDQLRSAAFYIDNIIYLLQNKLPEWGGQLYWAFPFS